MRALAVAAVLCCATACGTDPAVAPPTDARESPSAVSALVSGTCNETNIPSGWVERIYHCGQVVHVTSTVPELSAQISAAINIWNSAVFAHDGLPSFSATPGSPSITISWGNTFNLSPTPWYCGDNPSGGAITVHRAGAKADCGKTSTGGGTGFTNSVQAGGLPSLIAHELGHSIGFKHLSSIIVATGLPTVPAADHCVSSLPANGSLNGSVCQAEIELLHLNYGLRDTEVSPSKHIATGLSVSGPTQVNQGLSGTLTVNGIQFARVAPTFQPPNPSSLSYTWSSDNTAIARVSTGNGAANAIQAIAAGTTTIHVRLNSTTYEQAVPLLGSAISFTVVAPPTKPPPPTNLAASAVSFASATITWTNGTSTSGTTTTLQYRQNGVSGWTTASSTIGAGVASFGLSGLTPQKVHDVRVFHVRSGLNSDTLTRTSLFTTTAVPPPPSISNFHVTSCDQRPVGSKSFNYYQVAWVSATAASGYTFQIGVNTTSSSSGASVILTYPLSARTGEVGGYLVSPLLLNRWFWIRYVGNGVTGAWTALTDNPLATNACLQ